MLLGLAIYCNLESKLLGIGLVLLLKRRRFKQAYKEMSV